jgi:uncharacterized protein YjiS (DUF1127 family)
MRQIDRQAGFATVFATLATASAATSGTVGSPARGTPWRTGRLLARALDTVRLWQQRAQGRQQLRTFDDHLLRDIGITRLQAEAEAHKPFWRA